MLFIFASLQFFSWSSEGTFAFCVYLTCFDVKIYSLWVKHVSTYVCCRTKLNLLDAVVRSLETRFQCLGSSLVLKTASKLVDPREWPQDATELANFGTAELNVLLPHFGEILASQGCNLATARRVKWPKLKAAVKRLPMGMQSPSLWRQFATDQGRQEEIGNILQLFDIALVLPLSTVSVERGFSAMKRIKSDRRSKLNSSALSQLMYISIQGPDIHERNCLRALQRWWGERQRQRKPIGWCWTCSFSQAVPLQTELLHSLETCTVIVLLLSAINWLWVYTCCWLGKHLLWVDALKRAECELVVLAS